MISFIFSKNMNPRPPSFRHSPRHWNWKKYFSLFLFFSDFMVFFSEFFICIFFLILANLKLKRVFKKKKNWLRFFFTFRQFPTEYFPAVKMLWTIISGKNMHNFERTAKEALFVEMVRHTIRGFGGRGSNLSP